MSLHSSLKIDKASKSQRTVLSRVERIKDLMKKGQWSDEKDVTSLPKTKMLRIKAGKKKAKEAEGEAKDGAAAAPDAKAAGAKK